jgi:hypothetical protein
LPIVTAAMNEKRSLRVLMAIFTQFADKFIKRRQA